MNVFVEDEIVNFFNNHDVTIEGQGEKTWNKPGLSLTLKTDPYKYFVMLYLQNDDKYDWILHFENFSKYPYTQDEKDVLFGAVNDIIDNREVVTTRGGVTPGGIHALCRLVDFGFSVIDYRKDNLYWAENMIDTPKFNKWLLHAKEGVEYRVIDNKGWKTIQNTKPIVPILVKK